VLVSARHMERQVLPQRLHRYLPLVGNISAVAEITNLSRTYIRRLEQSDPDFPKSFKLHETGDRQWIIAEVLAWLEARAGRPLIAA
jgi:predicted DNA-binding transcriptional regulator AlpA